MSQEDLSSFLAVAAELQIKGLTDKDQLLSDSNVNQTTTASSKARQASNKDRDSNGPPPKKRRRRGRPAAAAAKVVNNDSEVQAVSVEVDPSLPDDENPDVEVFEKSFGSEGVEDGATVGGPDGDGSKAVFPESSVLQYLEHVVYPGSQRQYHCTLCGMMSPFNSTMKRHMLRIHTTPVGFQL